MADSAGPGVCRSCKVLPRVEGKMRCAQCIAGPAVVIVPPLGDEAVGEPTPGRNALEVWEAEQDDILRALADRAKKGDVQAAKLLIEAAKLARLEGESGARLTINDFIVPAGTVIDRGEQA